MALVLHRRIMLIRKEANQLTLSHSTSLNTNTTLDHYLHIYISLFTYRSTAIHFCVLDNSITTTTIFGSFGSIFSWDLLILWACVLHLLPRSHCLHVPSCPSYPSHQVRLSYSCLDWRGAIQLLFLWICWIFIFMDILL